MRINDDLRSYLEGKSFRSALGVTVRCHAGRVLGRREFLVSLASGKRVIHLGCVDHENLIVEKLARGVWLHSLLMEVAEECVGVDINRAGVELLKHKFGISNIFAVDLTREQIPLPSTRKWDYLLAPEVVEHVDNPVEFLRGVRENMLKHVTEFVVTAPNAFAIDNFTSALKSREWINSDHRYWFTPYTLAKVMTRAGYTVARIEMCASLSEVGRIWKRILLQKCPLLRPSIVVIGWPS